MDKNNEKILTIDVGGSTLKMAEFVAVGGTLTMTSFDYRKLDINADDGEEAEVIAFVRTYNEMIHDNHFTAKAVRLSLSAKLSFQRLSKLPPIPGNRNAIDKIVEYEARQTVPYAIHDVEWDYQLLRHQWTEKRVETQEDGVLTEVTEDKEEYEALFVAIKTDRITAYTDVIEDSGKRVVDVEIAPIALFNAALGVQVKNDDCVLMLNIGSSCSSLMISDHSRAFIRNIPIAGDTITNQIAKEFNISFDEAEQMKIRHGFVALGGAYEEPDSELAATISKIARNVMTRLHGEVSRSVNVWRAQHGGTAPTQVLLSGGGATMLYMTDFFQEKLRLPVNYLNTFSAISLGDIDKEKLQSVAPMCQELIGTALQQVTNCPVAISLLPRSIRKQYELNHRKPFFYASAGVLIGCLLLFGFGVNQLLIREQARVAKVKVKVEEITRKSSEVSKLYGELTGAKGRLDEISNIFKNRNRYIAVLQELQKIIPDQMWLVTVQPSDVMPPETVLKVAQNTDEFAGDSGSENSNTATVLTRDLNEIKYLILDGYTLSVRNTEKPRAGAVVDVNWLREFRLRLDRSKIFKGEGKLYKNDPAGNLTGFRLVVELNEPIGMK